MDLNSKKDLEKAEGPPGLRRRRSSCSPKTSLILSALNPASRATSWLKVAKSLIIITCLTKNCLYTPRHQWVLSAVLWSRYVLADTLTLFQSEGADNAPT